MQVPQSRGHTSDAASGAACSHLLYEPVKQTGVDRLGEGVSVGQRRFKANGADDGAVRGLAGARGEGAQQAWTVHAQQLCGPREVALCNGVGKLAATVCVRVFHKVTVAEVQHRSHNSKDGLLQHTWSMSRHAPGRT